MKNQLKEVVHLQPSIALKLTLLTLYLSLLVHRSVDV